MKKKNIVIEVSIVISEAKSSLTNKLCHEIHSECGSANGDLGDLLHDDGCVS